MKRPHHHRGGRGRVRQPDRRPPSPAHRRAVGRTGPFGERIAHGMLVLSYAVGLVDFDPERIAALRRIREVVFKRPVAIGDTISRRGHDPPPTPRDGTAW